MGTDDKVDMSSCVAYGQVSSTQAPHEVANNEGVYHIATFCITLFLAN